MVFESAEEKMVERATEKESKRGCTDDVGMDSK
jgi:hypothetical protein